MTDGRDDPGAPASGPLPAEPSGTAPPGNGPLPTPVFTRLRETNRLEGFSDAVFAVIITIMALEIRTPPGPAWRDLRTDVAPFLVHILSFSFLGLYWNNHHHLLRSAARIDGAVMWANLHLMFWLSLVPVATLWVDAEYRFTLPAASYGVIALLSAGAYRILVVTLVRVAGKSSTFARAIGVDWKTRLSMLGYAIGIAMAWLTPWASYGIYLAVTVIWFVPERRLHVHAVAAEEPPV